jgi:hypothetical protein
MIRLLPPLVVLLSTLIGVGDIIEPCMDTQSDALRIVSAGSACAEDETQLEWSILGPQWNAGPAGSQGPQGLPSLAGPEGPQGAAGAPGLVDLECATVQIIRWDEAAGQWACSDALTDLEAEVAVLKSLLTHVSRTGNTLVISGANLQSSTAWVAPRRPTAWAI